MSKKLVAVIIGGQSTEHEVSLISGTSVLGYIDRDLYEILLIGITKNGVWYQLPLENYLNDEKDISKVSLRLDVCKEINISFAKKGFFVDGDDVMCPDIVFPVLHGKNGEDGSIQGLCQLLEIPVVGCGVLSSAVCMDKDVTKRLLDQAGIKNAKYITHREYDNIDAKATIANLGLPLFVKSANGGSSVGVSKVHNEDELVPAINEGLKYDDKVVIEEAIVGRELECSVSGVGSINSATALGEIIPGKEEFYSYGAKYISDDGVTLVAPAEVDPIISENIRQIAIETYKCLDCSGLARVDFFLTGNNEIYVNEINTMPGFTSISMYPKLWELSGVGYGELVNGLIDSAMSKSKNTEEGK